MLIKYLQIDFTKVFMQILEIGHCLKLYVLCRKKISMR